VVTGGDNEDAATEERISQILSEAQAAMQKKHSDEQVYDTIRDGILNVTHQGAARDAASVHFRPSITRTDIVYSEENVW